jgi:glycosyltransferase involved in cell wall biosynthesis
VVDDASTDLTAERARDFAIGDPRFEVLLNPVRGGALYSRMRGFLHAGPQDSDLVFLIDGDDFLVDDDALSSFSDIADVEQRMVLYGDFIEADGTVRKGSPYPVEVIADGSFRKAAWRCYPLRAFRAGLVKHINPATHLMYAGKWIVNSSDKALLFCLLELADGKVRYVPGARYRVGMPTRSRGRAAIFSQFLVARMPPVPRVG